MRKNAFSLLELLVVLTIISLLSAILYSVVSRVRELTSRTVCQSNLRQIGLGILQYAQDYDDTMPGIYTAIEPLPEYATIKMTWMDLVYPYVKSEQVFTCPADNGFSVLGPGRYRFSADRSRFNKGTGSYGVNRAYPYNNPPIVDYRRGVTKLSGLESPSDTILVGDDWPTRWVFSYDFKSALPVPADNFKGHVLKGNFPVLPDNGGGLVARHQNMAAVVFCDGHVKAMKLEVLSQAGTTKSPQGWPSMKYWTTQKD